MRVKNYEIPEELQYDFKNYWIRKKDAQVQVGMSDYGQSTVGDVLYLEVGSEGTEIQQGTEFGSIEAGKWVGRLQAPLSGTIRRVHKSLEACPRTLNEDPYGEGWLYEMTLNSPQELEKTLDALQYADWVEEQISLEEQQEVLS